MTQGANRMELMLERLEGSAWHTVDPYVAPAQGDRVRFHFPNQLRRLQVMNAGKEYSVPATSITLRIAGAALRTGEPRVPPAAQAAQKNRSTDSLGPMLPKNKLSRYSTYCGY